MIVDDEGADAEHLDQLDVCSMDTSGGLLVIAQEAVAAALVLEATKKISASDDGASRAPSLSGGAGFDGMAVDAVEESSSEMQPLADQSAPPSSSLWSRLWELDLLDELFVARPSFFLSHLRFGYQVRQLSRSNSL